MCRGKMLHSWKALTPTTKNKNKEEEEEEEEEVW